MSVREMEPRETLAQIGIGNRLAISGGRATMITVDDERYPDMIMPVSSGYRVRISLRADDTYTVTREMKRGAKLFVKGVQESVYCDEIGDVAYYASCYRNVTFGEHVPG